MNTVWMENWDGLKTLMDDFAINDTELEGVNILLACYTYESYEGFAFVLFERNGDLFEVNGSHCSCYGLEGQWKPESTSIDSLSYRLDNGDFGSEPWASELRAVLARIPPPPSQAEGID